MSLNEPVPDIRSLDLLKSVAELRSIRQAAFKHLISQPAASMRLRTLERTLDLELLDRSHGRAELTPAGIAVVQWSKEVLEAMNNLKLGAQALGSDEKTHLRLVASMTVAEYLVPGWLHRLHISDPTIMVSLQMGNSQKVIEVTLNRFRGGSLHFHRIKFANSTVGRSGRRGITVESLGPSQEATDREGALRRSAHRARKRIGNS